MINRILNIGISEQNPGNLNKKIKLHNIIVLFVSIACLGYLPFYLHYELFILAKISVIILSICFFCLFLQFEKRHELGFSILIFSLMMLLNIITLYFGLVTNIHFFHICSCMAAITLFDRNKLLRSVIIGCSMFFFFALLILMGDHKGFGVLTGEFDSGLKIYGYTNYFVLFMFTVVFFTSVVKQNALFYEEITKQNAILEYKNRQITDSIKYAKHIQDAILPTHHEIKEHLGDSFVFYKPKDIVAGDFYWLEAREDNMILFAAADSTGHGVPGAMVSVICTNALNRAVKEFNLKEPGLILDKVRELVTGSFHQAGHDEVKDGMDISLCLFDTQKRTLQWAGANTPLWIIRKNSNELIAIDADKQSVAKTETPRPFTTHDLQMEEGDCFYLFTDGYADQFGGKKAKKYMQKRLKEFLLSIYKNPMESQEKLINDNLTAWQGNLDQVDDICFIGVRV